MGWGCRDELDHVSARQIRHGWDRLVSDERAHVLSRQPASRFAGRGSVRRRGRCRLVPRWHLHRQDHSVTMRLRPAAERIDNRVYMAERDAMRRVVPYDADTMGAD